MTRGNVQIVASMVLWCLHGNGKNSKFSSTFRGRIIGLIYS